MKQSVLHVRQKIVTGVKHRLECVDLADVVPFDTNTWLLLGLIAGILTLIFLYVLAAHYRNETSLHDLRLRVQTVRREFAERLERERAEQILEVAPVGRLNAPVAPPGATPVPGRAAA